MEMRLDWLTEKMSDGGYEMPIYSLDEAREKFEVLPLDIYGYLVLNWDKDKFWLRFAAMDFYSSNPDDTNIFLSCVFHGEGPTGALRECRHTWWGESGDGYLFSPDPSLIGAALKVLRDYYDFL